MSKLLSICIPTYNRSAFLKECLDSILSAIEGFEAEVEVVVSNNASTDETETIIAGYLRHPCLRYHKNSQNIGGERNFYMGAGIAIGQYVWIFGDDDKMAKEAIATVINKIKAGFNIIIANFKVWSADFTTVIKERGLALKKTRPIDNPNELLGCFGLHVGYISSVIMRREILFSCPPDEYERYIEYGYPHVLSIYTGALLRCNATYISDPIVYNRDIIGPYDKYKYFAVGSSLVFDALVRKGYSKRATFFAKHQVLRDLLILDIITRKLDGRSVKGIFGILFPLYKRHWLFWYGAIPMLYAPKFSIRILRKAVRAVRWLKITFRKRDRSGKA